MRTAAASVYQLIGAVVLWLMTDSRRLATFIVVGLLVAALLATFVLAPSGTASAMPMASSGSP